MSYYTKITTAGLAAITAAMNNSSKVPITYMAFGDGNGYIPEPDENATSLVNEVYRVGVNKVEVHSKNPNWLVCEAIIPSAVGGFNIREVALYDSTGNTMLAIASYPPTYKPTVEEGAAKIQTIRIVIQVDNSGSFELIVDPDVVLATIEYVNSLNRTDSDVKLENKRSQQDKNNENRSIYDFLTAAESESERLNPESFLWDKPFKRALDSDFAKILIPAKSTPYLIDFTLLAHKPKKLVGDGVENSIIKLKDQNSAYHNPNRTKDRNDKGQDSNLFEQYHSVMTIFSDNFHLKGLCFDANVMNNFIDLNNVIYHVGTENNPVGNIRYTHGIVFHSENGGSVSDRWIVDECKIVKTSYTGILVNHTSTVKYKGHFVIKESEISNTHEDSLSIHKIDSFEVKFNRFSNSHSHLNHFYYNASGGRVHHNEYYLDNSYLPIQPQYTTEKFAFIVGHNDYDNNICSDIDIFENKISNLYNNNTIPHMKLCLASIARTVIDLNIKNNNCKNLHYGINISGILLGNNSISGNEIEYSTNGIRVLFSGEISSSINTGTPMESKLLISENSFKYLGSVSNLSLYNDIHYKISTPQSELIKIKNIVINECNNIHHIGSYITGMNSKLIYINNEISENLLNNLNNFKLINNALPLYKGRDGTNNNVTYSEVYHNDNYRNLSGVRVRSTHPNGYPILQCDSQNLNLKTGLYLLSFYLKNLSSVDVKARIETVALDGSIGVLVPDKLLNSSSELSLINLLLNIQNQLHAKIRIKFVGVENEDLHFELFDIQMNQGSVRKKAINTPVDYFSDIIPSNTDLPVGTIVKNINPSTHIGWIYTSLGWKTYGAITA